MGGVKQNLSLNRRVTSGCIGFGVDVWARGKHEGDYTMLIVMWRFGPLKGWRLHTPTHYELKDHFAHSQQLSKPEYYCCRYTFSLRASRYS